MFVVFVREGDKDVEEDRETGRERGKERERARKTESETFSQALSVPTPPCMGWLLLVGSLKLQAFSAEYSLFHRALLQKRPLILRSLLIVATPF